eukprot:scaffold46295_cov62-Phaeocystis_antarctica.AAC.1
MECALERGLNARWALILLAQGFAALKEWRAGPAVQAAGHDPTLDGDRHRYANQERRGHAILVLRRVDARAARAKGAERPWVSEGDAVGKVRASWRGHARVVTVRGDHAGHIIREACHERLLHLQ